MTVRHCIDRILFRLGVDVSQRSYSQMGEDLMIAYHLRTRGFDLAKIRYLDVGACAPRWLSNTYYFYRLGASGVLVEPDQDLIPALKKARSRDRILNIGIANTGEPDADFFVIDPPTLNSFSPEMRDFVASPAGRKAYGEHIRVKEVRKVKMVTINALLEEHFAGKAPDLVSIDAEGLDWQILSSLDFSRHQPYVICTEINENYDKILDLMGKHGYCLTGYNQLNAIFMR